MILDMPRGRPSSIPRTAFGRRLVQAREQAGFTQSELAQKLGILQRTVAYWERLPYSLRPDQIARIAEVLKVPVEQLLFDSLPKPRPGPAGKVKEVFEEVARLPRPEQRKIVDVVKALVAQSNNGNGHKQAA